MKKLILGIGVVGGLLSCGPPPDPELTCDPTPAAATLATNAQAVFDTKCKSCHADGYSYGDYSSPEKTAASVAKKSIYAAPTAPTLMVVEAKSLANSSLWLKVLGGATAGRTGPKGENVQGRMPQDGSMLTTEEKKILKDWICNGAK